MPRNKRKRFVDQMDRDIETIIGSDDEFPNDCDEEREIPCYLNNDRFTKSKDDDAAADESMITFPWLTNMKIRTFDDDEEQRKNLKTNPMKGVLSSQDMLCAKCIIDSGYSVDFCVWFLEYLKMKDMQPKLWNKSCLVLPIF